MEKRRCIVEGCECKDPRILNRRHARFVRATHGEGLANRVVPVEAGWRIPTEVGVPAATGPASMAR